MNDKQIYAAVFEKIKENLDLSHVPNKYLNPKKNWDRYIKPIRRAKGRQFKRGLDFGCGCVGSPIMGRIMGMSIVGVDIPFGVDDSKEGNRNRDGLKAKDVKNNTSVHVPMQEKMIKMGYEIYIKDTNIYPWSYLKDNEFDFVLAYFALSKEWVNHADTLDFSGDVYGKRIKELVRVCKPNSIWYIHPKNHITSTKKYLDILKFKNIKMENWNG